MLDAFDPDLKTLGLFVVLYYVAGLVVKTLDLRRHPVPRNAGLFVLLGPFYGTRTWADVQDAAVSSWSRIGREAAWVLPVYGFAFLAYWTLLSHVEVPLWTRMYLGVPMFYLITRVWGLGFRLFFLLWGLEIPAVHRSPFRAKSLAAFWGVQWNRWVHDWLYTVIFQPFRRTPQLAVAVTFLVSGLWHEWILNVPYYLATGQARFGWVTGYFMVQLLGIFIERTWLRDRPRAARKAFLWICVVLPVPLIFNAAFREIFLL